MPENIKKVIEYIAKSLVEKPEKVYVSEKKENQVVMLEIHVDKGDLGKVIGKQGRTARAIRTILGAAGMKLRKRFVLEILE